MNNQKNHISILIIFQLIIIKFIWIIWIIWLFYIHQCYLIIIKTIIHWIRKWIIHNLVRKCIISLNSLIYLLIRKIKIKKYWKGKIIKKKLINYNCWIKLNNIRIHIKIILLLKKKYMKIIMKIVTIHQIYQQKIHNKTTFTSQ